MPSFKDGIGEKNEVIMTDKQIIKTLQSIKELCAFHRKCDSCRFYLRDYYTECQLIELINLLGNAPQHWDMEEIERIINE